MNRDIEEEEQLVFVNFDALNGAERELSRPFSSPTYGTQKSPAASIYSIDSEESDEVRFHLREYIPSLPWYKRPSILFILPVYFVAAVESSM